MEVARNLHKALKMTRATGPCASLGELSFTTPKEEIKRNAHYQMKREQQIRTP